MLGVRWAWISRESGCHGVGEWLPSRVQYPGGTSTSTGTGSSLLPISGLPSAVIGLAWSSTRRPARGGRAPGRPASAGGPRPSPAPAPGAAGPGNRPGRGRPRPPRRDRPFDVLRTALQALDVTRQGGDGGGAGGVQGVGASSLG